MSSDGPVTETVDEPIPPERSPERPQPYLFVVLQCDRPLAGAARYGLADIDHVSIGRGLVRSATRDPRWRRLHLQLPSSYVSSLHAELHRAPGGWMVYDHQSRNGTYLNGERTAQGPLHDGDILQIGHTILRFRRALPPSDDLDTGPLAPDGPGAPVSGLTTLLPDLGPRLAALESIARSTVPVLLLGETGTGKEVLAHAIHALSGRTGRLVAVNCGGLPLNLIESQIFGHKKGAFTGAQKDEPGLARTAHQGTLFLDEIGDLPLAAQVALLRVLQEGEVVPVGDTRPHKVDLRVVAATHQPLDAMAERKDFRSDLFARLSGYRHDLAPLRDRSEDLGLLVGMLLARLVSPGHEVPRLTPEVGRLLLQYPWPLNIRELKQCLAAALALAPGGLIEAEHLPPRISDMPPPRPGLPRVKQDPEGVRDTLITLLEQHAGNVSQVARKLGKARSLVHRWLEQCGIDPNDFRSRRPKGS